MLADRDFARDTRDTKDPRDRHDDTHTCLAHVMMKVMVVQWFELLHRRRVEWKGRQCDTLELLKAKSVQRFLLDIVRPLDDRDELLSTHRGWEGVGTRTSTNSRSVLQTEGLGGISGRLGREIGWGWGFGR